MIEKPNFIEVYENVFDKTYCNACIEVLDKCIEQGLSKNRQQHDNASKLSKEDEAYFIPDDEFNFEHSSLAQEFNNTFWNVVYPQYAQKYAILDHSPMGSYTMKLQRTLPGQGYHEWHCENMARSDCHRNLTWTVYLNDSFEAGETEFLYQHYRYKPKMGDVIIFPSAFTHTHRGNPPIGGTKYIITGWLEF